MSVYSHVTPILLAIYLLIGNVMLLNLLIAIFTSVFEEVHKNSREIWKWEMYRLVEEYDQRPGLAPPFVILEDLWKLLKGIWKLTCRRNKENCKKCLVFSRLSWGWGMGVGTFQFYQSISIILLISY